MSGETTFILLFIVATAVAIVVQRLKIPYTVALVASGLLLGSIHALKPPILTKELLYTVFLPGLLFEAAFHIDFEQFWRNKKTIVSLAVPGVIAATALIALILTPVADAVNYVKNFDWRYSLVFGALIAATDPIAVMALFRKIGAPKRLNILIQGESLLNDGTGIVFFTLSLSIATGVSTSAAGLILDFFKIVGFGLLTGGVVGLAVSQVTKQINEPMIEITLTTVGAYGDFVAAEHLGFSGVIATVTAGMICGNYGAQKGMSPSTRLAVESFWEYVAFAMNSIVFLLIGFEVRIADLVASWQMILVAYLAVTVGRALVISGVSLIFRFSKERIPWSWSVFLFWGGLRGALPMVLVLSLPVNFPHRDLLATMTFGVVIISIMFHGLTAAKLIEWLGIVTGQEPLENYFYLQGKLRAADAAMADIEHLDRARLKDEGVMPSLRKEYEKMIKDGEERLNSLRIDHEELKREEMQRARRELILAEKKHIIESFHRGMLSQRVYERLLDDADARLLKMETEMEKSE